MRRFGKTVIDNHSNRVHRSHIPLKAGPPGSPHQEGATSEAETNRYTKAGRAQESQRDKDMPKSHEVRGVNTNIYQAPTSAYSTQNPPHTMIGPGKSSNHISRAHTASNATSQNYTYGNSNLHRKHQPQSAPVIRKSIWTKVTHPGAFSGK